MSGVKLTNVKKAFGGHAVIKDVSLEVPKGDFGVFVGPSGCGKSTLLRMIAGLEETSGGKIEIGGRDVTAVEPAQRGTRNVLEEANAQPSVRRVVVTSSCAAIYGDNADLEGTPGGVFTEEVWNTSSSLDHQPYAFSKTLAEREAWAIAEAQDRWDLVVVNPAFVLGPGVRADATSESFSLMRQLGDGTFAMGMPAMGMGIVDVRDVAEAHLRAGTRPEAHGRNIVVGHDSDLADVAAILREHFGERFAFPRRTLPKWLVWLAGPMTNPLLTRKVVSRNIGLPWKSDNGKVVRELGLTYRPLATTVIEMFQQQAEAGLVPPRGEERAAA